MGRTGWQFKAVWCLVALAPLGCSRNLSETQKQTLHRIAAADRVTLYSIDIDPKLRPEAAERFQGYPVLGKLDITEAGPRRQILDAVENGIRRCDMETGYNCFWPRHGIRAERGGESTDFVICFECAQIYVYDKQGSEIDFFFTTKEPQPTLDRHLTAAKVPLAPPGSVRRVMPQPPPCPSTRHEAAPDGRRAEPVRCAECSAWEGRAAPRMVGPKFLVANMGGDRRRTVLGRPRGLGPTVGVHRRSGSSPYACRCQ